MSSTLNPPAPSDPGSESRSKSSKRPFRRAFWGRFGGLLLSALRRWVRNRTAIQAEQAGIKLGRAFFRISAKHRGIADRNLAMAFPGMPEKDRRSLARKVFEHFGILALDFVRSDRRSDQEVLDSTEFSGHYHFPETLALGKGALVVGMHFGNWERAAQYSAARGYPLSAVARDADEEGLQAQVKELREASKLNVLSRGNAIRAMLTALRSGHGVAILVDQNADEAFVPFFGKPAGTTLGAAVLHLRTGAPIVISFLVRTGPAKYRLLLDPPLDFTTYEPKPSPEEIMGRIHARFEEIIREYPEQWLWFHDRWKSARQRGML